MNFLLYIKCFLIANLGEALSMALILNSLQKKARLANLQFSVKQYFRDEIFIIIANSLWVVVAMLLIDFFVKWKSEWEVFIVPGFFFIGYLGSDVASRLASIANKKLNAAIDYKTTIADQTTGNLGAPTPTK